MVTALEASAEPLMDTPLRSLWPDGPGDTSDPAQAGAALRRLAAQITLSAPGRGRTRQRFDALRLVGELDLTVGRLWEAHCDASAILSELDAPAMPAGSVWGVWAAEAPDAPVTARSRAGRWRLDGHKGWCSGAGITSHALVTALAPDGPRLFAVDLSARGVTPANDAWPAPALRGTDTRSVNFKAAPALPVGGPGDYLGRPGFWYGAAGVAAVWLGGAIAVAREQLRAARRRHADDIGLVRLGEVDAALHSARAAVTNAADEFDADPSDIRQRAALLARRVRASVEHAVDISISTTGRALGPGPLSSDAGHAQRVADLMLYVRQSHAERDLADLGRRLLTRGDDW